MADDDMLLNFAAGENDRPSSTLKFRGGSWRDRMVAKKKAIHYQLKGRRGQDADATKSTQKSQISSNDKGSQFEDFLNPRPAKRLRQDGGDQLAEAHTKTRKPLEENSRQRNGQQIPKEREVISSLFSYNPKPSSMTQNSEKNDDAHPTQPSNAPLPDGIDTFTTLGLTTSLAAHLLTKMELRNPTAIQKASIARILKEDSDVFIQSETGSGKTLAYLLPIVQKIMAVSDSSPPEHSAQTSNGTLHRNSGLFAIVLAPTRELCKQISVVLDRLLCYAPWIVASSVIGGERKKSEKARIRKGVNILVATPGRLVDHLENTKVLDVKNVKWLVLDEGDRLMDLGFEDEIEKIVKKLDASQHTNSLIKNLPSRRVTILCSATMKMNVQRLGEISLKDAILVQSHDDSPNEANKTDNLNEPIFYAPAQLKQSYTVVPAKLRLVSLMAFLKRNFARKGSVMKAIVFVSCADSVDFHFEILTHSLEDPSSTSSTSSPPIDNTDPASTPPHQDKDTVRASPTLSPTSHTVFIHKLHGSLPQQLRTATVSAFSRSTTPSLLIATDVASRGLDLPNLDLVIEYDPAFSADDHLHRIGRTARLGRDGRAMIFLMPGPEEGYVEVLRKSYRQAGDNAAPNLSHLSGDEILRRGFSGTSTVSSNTSLPKTPVAPVTTTTTLAQARTRAEQLQLSIERLLLPQNKTSNSNSKSQSQSQHQSQQQQQLAALARRAFQSHIRAYATHVGRERKYFDLHALHLGHLAKAFGLRERPGNVSVGAGVGGRTGNGNGNGNGKGKGDSRKRKRGRGRESGGFQHGGDGNGNAGGEKEMRRRKMKDEAGVEEEARVKMRRGLREQQRRTGTGAGEFNIA